jgi:hypothetical protein
VSPRPNNPDDAQDRQPDLGGADAVPDTPNVAGHGAEPGFVERRKAPRGPSPRPPLARVKTGGGIGILGWAVLALAALVALAYAIGLFR